MNLKTILLFSAFAVVSAAQAGTTTGVAATSSTVRPAGPRVTGTPAALDQRFLNAEAGSNGANASFGVLDFNASSFTFPAGSTVVAAELDLVESDASFTAPGTLQFYAAFDTTTAIDASSPLKYMVGAANNGVGTQLGTLLDLGTGSFTSTGSTNTGIVDKYVLTLDPTAVGLFASALTSGSGKIRIVVANFNDSALGVGAGTFAGTASTIKDANGNVLAAPSLVLTTQAVPEPSAFAALGLGAMGLLKRRRRA